MASGRIPGPIGRQTPQIDSGTLARTDSPTRGPIGAGQAGKNADLAKQKRELALDIAQLTLDIAGIFDPTPITDGANTLLALARGNWFDALTSAVSMVPYIGDLAKTAKLPKYIASVRKAVGVARLDPKWAANLRELFVKLKTYVDKCLDVGADALPDVAKKQLKQLQDEIDRFLNPRAGMAPKGPSAAGGGGPAKSTRSSSNGASADTPKAPEPIDKKGEIGHSSDKKDVELKTTKGDTSKAGKDNKSEEKIVATSDEAADNALKEYNSVSIKENREYGGLVYKDSSGQYGHTKGTRGSIDGVSPWDGDPIPEGTEEVGYWHTHGNYSKMKDGELVPTDNKSADWYDSDNFSPQDIDVANEIGKDKTEYRGYVGTPSGEFKGYDAKTKKQYTIKKD